MPEVPLIFPLGGISDNAAYARQAPFTTREAVNVRAGDPTNGRMRGAQRAGTAQYVASRINSSNKVSCIASVVADNRRTTYSNLSPAYTDVKDSVEVPSKESAAGCLTDAESNVYVLDGPRAVAKYNADLKHQWTWPAPVVDKKHVCRALALGVDGLIYVGTSSGGKSEDGRIWCFEQLADNKTGLVWTLEIGGYAEAMKAVDGILYTAQNFPDKNAALLVAYTGISTANPSVHFQTKAAYPVNGLDTDADGNTVTTSEASTRRAIDDRYVEFSPRSTDWTIRDLTDYKKRIWGDWDARSITGLDEGEPVLAWEDSSGHDRFLFPPEPLESPNTTVPVYTKEGFGSGPGVRLNGIVSGNTQALISGTNPAGFESMADQQRSVLPQYPKGPCAIFIVLRAQRDTQMRPIFVQDDNTTASGQTHGNANKLIWNRASHDRNTGLDPDPGRCTWMSWHDNSVSLPAGGNSAGTVGGPFTMDWDYGRESAATLITILHDSNENSTTNAAQHSVIRVYGRPVDRWVGIDWVNSVLTYIGKDPIGDDPLTTYGQFDVSRIIVVGPYSTGGATGNPLSGNTTNAGTPTFYPRTIAATIGGSSATNWVGSATNQWNDYEIERIEGYLAHENGISHLLPPTGTVSVFSFVTAPVDGDTIVIDATTYTWKAALTTTAYQLKIQTLNQNNARILYRAINESGTPGTDYSIGTLRHPKFRATVQNRQDDSGTPGTGKVKIERRTSDTTAYDVAVTGGYGTWSNDPTATTQATVVTDRFAYMPGHYPHPFFQEFGPPRKDPSAVTVLPYASGTGYLPFLGQQIIGVTSGAKGRVAEIRQGATVVAGTLVLRDVSGTFAAAEVIGGTNTLSATSGTPIAGIGVAYESDAHLLNSANAVTAKYGPGGELKWVLTNRSAITSPVGAFPEWAVGANGWGVRWAKEKVVTYTIAYTAGTGSAPSAGLAVTGATSGATGVVVTLTSVLAATGTITVRGTNHKAFVEGEVIAGGSWANAIISAGMTQFETRALYLYGPRYDATAGEKSYHVRRVIDGGDCFSIWAHDGGWGATNATLAGAGTPDDGEYHYPRMEVDKYDNLYVPYFETNGATQQTLVALNKEGTVLFRFGATSATANLPGGLAVAVDPGIPEYGTSNLTRAENIYVATNRGAVSPITGTKTVYRVPIASVALTTGSPRAVTIIGVSAGVVKRFTSSAVTAFAGPKTLASPQMATNAPYVCAVSAFSKVFLTDGNKTFVFDPVEDTFLEYKPTKSGKAPQRQKLLFFWRGRLGWARGADNPHAWFLARMADPFDVDTNPPVLDGRQAIFGTDSRIGLCPDIVNCVVPIKDDLLLFLCDHSIHRLTGDPAAEEAQFHPITTITGGSFGQRAATMDPDGNLYFAGSRGQVFRMAPPYIDPVPMTNGISRRLSEVNLANYYFELVWNTDDDGLHVFVCPYGAGGTLVDHYFWERKAGRWMADGTVLGWWNDRFFISNLQPTCAYVLDGDEATDRILITGSEDGFIRKWSPTSYEDDGYQIDTPVLFPPITSGDSRTQAKLTSIQITLADEQFGCNYELLAGQSADRLGFPLANGLLSPGRNLVRGARARGNALWVRLRNSQRATRWAFESGSVNVQPAGRARVTL